MKPFDPQLSRARSILFLLFAIVWFSEMVLWGFQTLARYWTNTWIVASDDPLWATALYLTHAVHSPAKGALGVMAIYGLMSRSPFARTALFIAMALVPPLNLAFPFRAQGFPLTWVVVPVTLSVIVWGTFFLSKDPRRPPEPKGGSGSTSRWEIFRYFWFAANSAVLTLLASLFLFWPARALNLVHPCYSPLLAANPEQMTDLVYSGMTSGTHLLALAIASWTATIYCRHSPALRNAMAMTSTVHAGLFMVFPLRQMATELGAGCAATSLLILFVPLFVCWLVYLLVDARNMATTATAGTRIRAAT